MPDLNYLVIARDQGAIPPNVPVTGLSPQWVFLSRLADGAAVAQPPITEIGFGQYRIAYDPEAKGEASGQIDLGSRVVDAGSRYLDIAFYLNEARTTFNLDAPISSRMPSPNVMFLGADSATQGNWRGIYGAEGSWIPGDATGSNPVIPSYATAGVIGGTSFVWAATSTESRVLQKTDGSGRIASCWYSTTSMNFALSVSGDKPRRVSLYAMDYETANRNMRFEVLDPTGNVVDTRTITSFRNGTYVTWSLKGQVTIRVTNLQSTTNAVISGLFFG